MNHLTLRKSVEALEDLGSDEDEIVHEDDLTTPNDLLDTLREAQGHKFRRDEDLDEIPTDELSIGFTKLDGTYVKAGTFAGMIQDRMAD